MPWHDISDGGVLALVHQEDGRHLHSAPHRSPEWASERWWLREDGFEFPGARQLGNRPIRPRAAPTSKVRKTLDTTKDDDVQNLSRNFLRGWWPHGSGRLVVFEAIEPTEEEATNERG